MSGRRGCEGINDRGLPCGAASLRDRPFCLMHDPDQADVVAASRALGRLHRQKEAAIKTTYDLGDLRDPEGRWRLLEVTVRETLQLPNSLQRSRVLLNAVSVADRLATGATLEARVIALEAQDGIEPLAPPTSGSLLDEEPDAPG